jgi:hypothetical protein
MFLKTDDRGGFLGRCRSHAYLLSGETPFPEKAALVQYRDDGFLALFRDDGELDFTLLDIEHGIRRVSLRKENFLFRHGQCCFADADLCEEFLGIKRRDDEDSLGLPPLRALPLILR